MKEICIGISPYIHGRRNQIRQAERKPAVYPCGWEGQKGGSQAIKNMLTYIQNSDSKNAVDDATRMMDSYVEKVKNLPEVEAGFMTLGDWIDSIVEEAVEEAKRDMREEMAEEVKQTISGEITQSVTEEVTKTVTEEVTSAVTKEVREQDMKIIVEMLQEYNATKENAVIKLQAKFPQNAGLAAEIVEKYWQEN